jgi:hypothetical protein
MSVNYVIVLVHDGLYDFADDLMESVRNASNELFRKVHLVVFRDDVLVEDQESSSLVVYLGSRSGHDHKRVNQVLGQAIDAQIPIFPIVRDTDDGAIHDKIPSIIASINVANWTASRESVLTELLGVIGLVDVERKVFLSYVRRETSPIALQLHGALVQARFDVFLDRFAIPPGVDFQSRIDEELEDKAFVVLLESAGLKDSRWVQHEIAYAHSHRISVLSLTVPEVGDAELVSAVDDAFRVRLSTSDIQPGGELNTTTLNAILERIEQTHARSLRRRREQLLGSMVDCIRRDGCECETVDDWALFASGDGRRPSVFLVTPRRPQPQDLRSLDCIRRRTLAALNSDIALSAAVVHDVEHIPDGHQRLMEWISAPRNLSLKRLLECKLEAMSP